MTTPSPIPRLRYFADPMCSWCWGYAPVLQRLRDACSGRVAVDLVLGGLRVVGQRPIDDHARAELAAHWQHVREASGQPIVDIARLPADLVYNTRRPCEAVVAARRMTPEAGWVMLTAIQSAFYTAAAKVTDDAVLIALAEAAGLDRDRFAALLGDAQTTQQAEADFEIAQSLGVYGFPALIAEFPERRRLVHIGFRSWSDLRRDLAAKGVILADEES